MQYRAPSTVGRITRGGPAAVRRDALRFEPTFIAGDVAGGRSGYLARTVTAPGRLSRLGRRYREDRAARVYLVLVTGALTALSGSGAIWRRTV